MGRLWLGEAVGFTEWLRLEEDPDVVRSIALDLMALEPESLKAICAEIGLPLHRGMTQVELEQLMGQPVETERFVPDRYSVIFRVRGLWAYDVDCTLHERDGLIYAVIMVAGVTETLGHLEPHTPRTEPSE